MTDLERRRLKLERTKVLAAKEEQEFMIAQREEEITRLKEQMLNQDKRVAELDKMIAEPSSK